MEANNVNKTKPIVSVGFLIQFEVKPGTEAKIEASMKRGVSEIQKESGTIAWFAFKTGPTQFGVFDVFPTEEDRNIHYIAGSERLKKYIPDMVEHSIVVRKTDIITAKLP